MRIIRLTESDLTRIVKTVIKEQELMPFAYQYTRDKQTSKAAPAKENINPKNLKVGDGGKNNPGQVADVKKLQQKLIDLGLLSINSPTGYFGEKTQQALDAYNKSGASAGAATGAATGSSSTTQDLPFKNRAEGNAFRKWMNDNYSSIAKKFNLDREGSHTNAFIKKVFNSPISEKTSTTWGQFYLRQTGGKVSGSTDGKVSGTSGSTPSKPETKPQGGFIIIFAFPTYKPSLEPKGTDIFSDLWRKMTKLTSGTEATKTPALGHGGCVIIDNTGNSVLYEFGRYVGSEKGFGKVLSVNLGKIAKIQDGKLMNAQEVAEKAKPKTEGEGPNQPLEGVVFKLPDPAAATSYASVKKREYDLVDMSTLDQDANCGTFAIQVAKAGGVKMPVVSVPAPRFLITTLSPFSSQFVKA